MIKTFFFRNLHLKIFALLAAAVFWFVVVSMQNTFYELPEQAAIQVFNIEPDLALPSQLGSVKLTLRAPNQAVFRGISAGDFEPYVDLRNVGAGKRRVSVSVSSKNPQISIAQVVPSEVEIELEPVREKFVSLSAEVMGRPARGYKVQNVVLSKTQVKVKGAQSVLARISGAKAQIFMLGAETENVTKQVQVKIFDSRSVFLEGVEVQDGDIEAVLTIVEVETTRQIGVKPKISGALSNGAVKSIAVAPAVVEVSGRRESLEALSWIETEPLDLAGISASAERRLGLVLPDGISLAQGQSDEVMVRIEIEEGL